MAGRISFNLLISLLLLSTFIFFQNPLSGQSNISIQNQSVDSLVENFYSQYRLPGVSVSISIAGEVRYSGSRGFANLADSTTIESCCSLFRIGSVVKPMTATILMQLVDEGKIKLEDNIGNHLDSLENSTGNITPEQLARHTAGIRHYRGMEFLLAHPYPSVKKGLDIFIADSLLHAPGSAYLYSSYGYNLMGAWLEAVTGKNFEQLLEDRIFTPAGMKYSFAEHATEEQRGRVSFYTQNDNGELMVGRFVDNYYKLPSGGALASTEDLLRFGEGILNQQLISSTLLEKSLQPTILPGGDTINYGIGWSISPEDAKWNYFYHGGGSVGGSTMLMLFPEHDCVIAVATNCSSIPLTEFSLSLAGTILH